MKKVGNVESQKVRKSAGQKSESRRSKVSERCLPGAFEGALRQARRPLAESNEARWLFHRNTMFSTSSATGSRCQAFVTRAAHDLRQTGLGKFLRFITIDKHHKPFPCLLRRSLSAVLLTKEGGPDEVLSMTYCGLRKSESQKSESRKFASIILCVLGALSG